MSPAPSYAAKRDAVEPEVVAEFQRLGCSVQPLNGTDIPDLLVGVPTGDGGVTVLVEVKTNNAALKPGQAKWHAAWRGGRPHVIRNAAQARKLVVMTQAESDPFDTPASLAAGPTEGRKAGEGADES